MVDARQRWDALGVPAAIHAVRALKFDANQSLLGDTISISDAAWQQPTRLPGWTRAHVATHLARNADALRSLTHNLLTMQRSVLYGPEREEEIEQGSRRSGLELQIDLDTSAGRLNEMFNFLEESGVDDPVRLTRSLVVPAQLLPVARLAEVVLHHIDLETGYTLDSVHAEVAHLLVAWELFRTQGDSRYPTARVITDSGLDAVIGTGGPAAEFSGSDRAVLGWLSGRSQGEGVRGHQLAPDVLPPH